MSDKDKKKVFKEALKSEVNPLLIGLRNEVKKVTEAVEKAAEKTGKTIVEVNVEQIAKTTEETILKTIADSKFKGEPGEPGKSIEGQPGKNGKSIRGLRGLRGKAGKNAITPIKGKDYFTKNEIKEFLKTVTPVKGKDYNDGANADPFKVDAIDIRNALESLKGKDRLNISAIKDLEERLSSMSSGGIGSGADAVGIRSIVAGLNITVDSTDPYNPIVSSTGGGGGAGDEIINVNDIGLKITADNFLVSSGGGYFDEWDNLLKYELIDLYTYDREGDYISELYDDGQFQYWGWNSSFQLSQNPDYSSFIYAIGDFYLNSNNEQGVKISQVADPVVDRDAVPKIYVDEFEPNFQTLTAGTYDQDNSDSIKWIDASSGDVIINLLPIADAKRKPFTYMRRDDSGYNVKLVPYHIDDISSSVNLVAHYKFNDNAADAIVYDDISANNGTATFNTEDNSISGKINEAFSFNGSFDSIFVNENDDIDFGTGKFSIFFQIKTSSNGFYLSSRDADPGLIGVFPSHKFGFYDGTSWHYSAQADVDDGNWHSIGITRNGGTYTLYTDGIADVYSGNASFSYSGNLYLGTSYAGSPFVGDIDDVRLYNGELSSGAVSYIVNSGSGTENENRLIAHYTLDDNASNTDIIDNVNGYNGTASTNTDSLSVSGKINQAISFNGSQQINLGLPDALDFIDSFSVSMQILVNANNVQEMFMSYGATKCWLQQLNNGALEFNLTGDSNGVVQTNPNALTTGTFHHVVATYDAQALEEKIYVDNVRVDTILINTVPHYLNAAGGYLALGSFGISGGLNLNGAMCDVRFYQGVLREEDISIIYNNNLGTEQENNMITQYKLNDNAPTSQLIDSKGGYHATLQIGNSDDYSQSGKINDSIGFGADNTSGTYAFCPDMGEIRDYFSISYWFNIATGTTQSKHFGSRSGSDKSIDGDINTLDTYHIDFGNGTNWISTTDLKADGLGMSDDGTWYHVAATFTKVQAKLYFNGELKTTVNYAEDSPLLVDSSHRMAIGTYGTNGGDFNTGGSIDDFRMYNVALTDGEVKAIYNAGSGTEDALTTQLLPIGATTPGYQEYINQQISMSLLYQNTSATIITDGATEWGIIAKAS